MVLMMILTAALIAAVMLCLEITARRSGSRPAAGPDDADVRRTAADLRARPNDS